MEDGNGVASPDACNQFRTTRAITISARSQLCAHLSNLCVLIPSGASVRPPHSLGVSLATIHPVTLHQRRHLRHTIAILRVSATNVGGATPPHHHPTWSHPTWKLQWFLRSESRGLRLIYRCSWKRRLTVSWILSRGKLLLMTNCTVASSNCQRRWIASFKLFALRVGNIFQVKTGIQNCPG